MKKFILCLSIILGLAATNEAKAQFTIAKDTAKGVISDAGGKITNSLTNTSPGANKYDWKIISTNITSANGAWYNGFGLCDNQYCYDKGVLSGSTQTSLDVASGTTMTMYVSYGSDISAATSTGPYYAVVEVAQGTNKDTTTFVFNKWATGVNAVATKSTDNVILYPNPVRDDLNIVFAGMTEVKSLGIYNLIGKQVGSYKVNNTSASVSLEGMPAGIYMLRLMDGQGHIVAVRKFNKQ